MTDKATSDEIKALNAALREEVRELADKVGALAESNDALVESNKNLTDSDTAQRHGLYALTAGGIALIGVIAVMIYAIVQIDHAQDRIDKQGEYDLAACERGNESRAAQRQQWADVRSLLVALGAGRDTRQLAAGLVANANKNFASVDCEQAVQGDATHS